MKRSLVLLLLPMIIFAKLITIDSSSSEYVKINKHIYKTPTSKNIEKKSSKKFRYSGGISKFKKIYQKNYRNSKNKDSAYMQRIKREAAVKNHKQKLIDQENKDLFDLLSRTRGSKSKVSDFDDND